MGKNVYYHLEFSSSIGSIFHVKNVIQLVKVCCIMVIYVHFTFALLHSLRITFHNSNLLKFVAFGFTNEFIRIF